MKGEILTKFTNRLREWGVPQAPARARALVADLEQLGIRLSVPTHADDPNADWRRPATPRNPAS
jgi:hypothetical protein